MARSVGDVMAYEWVAPSATAVTAGLGLFFTWLTGKQGREHAQDVSRQATAAARQLARDARRGDAYVDLLAYVTQAGYALSMMNPIVEFADAPDPPALAEPHVQALYNAKVHAYGTAEVIRLYDEWDGHARKMITNARLLNLARSLAEKGLSTGADVAAHYPKQAEELNGLIKAANELRQLINQELSGD